MATHKEQDESLRAREYRFYPFLEAILIGIVFFGATSVTTYFIYHHALAAQEGEIREGLVRTGQVLTRFVDGDLHQTFTSPDQKDSPEYREAIDPLRKAMDADDSIPFVYTTVLKDERVYFVLDAVPADDPDAVELMEEYTNPSDEMLTALREERVTTSDQVHTDEWGSYISAHVPIRDSQNEFVGILGVDIDATAYQQRLEPIQRATTRAMVTAFFISYLVAALVWFMRHFSAVINRKRLKVLQYLNLKADED